MSDPAEIELKALARKVKRMRQLQRSYFDQRRRKDPDADSTLIASKRAEAEVDEAVAQVLDFRTPSLPWDTAGGT
jgi:hypothetical protein